MEKNKSTQYIIIGLVVLLAIILTILIYNKQKSPVNPVVNDVNQQNTNTTSSATSFATSSDQAEENTKDITSNELARGTLILWATEKTYDGNLGGREGADKLCQSEMPSNLRCSGIHAFISVKPDDTIKDMPKVYGYEANRAIYWYNKSSNKFIQAANNWQDLLDGTISVSPNEGTGDTVNYWVGSNPDGSLNDKNCQNWTANGPTMSGAEGRGAVNDSRWLGKGSLSCEGKDNLLCICQK